MDVVAFIRPYRAPELLFGVRKYDATACDLWALGATFAEFFTTLHRRPLSNDFDDDSDTEERGDPTKAYLLDEVHFPPREQHPLRLTYYNACSFTHPIRVSRLLMR